MKNKSFKIKVTPIEGESFEVSIKAPNETQAYYLAMQEYDRYAECEVVYMWGK